MQTNIRERERRERERQGEFKQLRYSRKNCGEEESKQQENQPHRRHEEKEGKRRKKKEKTLVAADSVDWNEGGQSRQPTDDVVGCHFL